jgi:hypothetical protein
MSIEFYEGSDFSVGNYMLCPSKLLGSGATGKVYKGYDKFSLASVAIKHVDLSTINDDPTRALLEN